MDEWHDKPIILDPVVITVMAKVHVDNIWALLYLVEETQEEKREKSKRKHQISMGKK